MLGTSVMVVDIALFGLLTATVATIAAVFVSRDDTGVTNEQLIKELRTFRDRVDAIER